VPASPPHSGKDDAAERPSAAPPATRQASEPARPSAPERPEPAAERPTAERPAPAATGTTRAPAVPPAVVPAGAVLSGDPVDVLRKNWDAVLDSVKRERRVAWILLSDTSVVSVEGGILTLRFAKEGDLKRFSTSDYDADLKRVLSTGFGMNVMVRGVVGEGDTAAGTPGRHLAAAPAFAAPRAEPAKMRSPRCCTALAGTADASAGEGVGTVGALTASSLAKGRDCRRRAGQPRPSCGRPARPTSPG